MNTQQLEVAPQPGIIYATAIEAKAESATSKPGKSPLKIVGREFLNHLLLGITAGVWLPRFVGPTVSLLTKTRIVSPHWQTGAMLLLLFGYGFCIGKSDPAKRVIRLLLQISFYVGSAILLLALVQATSQTVVVNLILVAASLAGGALAGSLFTPETVPSENEAKKQSVGVMSILKKGAGFALAIGFGLALIFGSQTLGKAAQKTIYVDKLAPATVYETADGEPWSFGDRTGKVVLIKFWAPYCAPCVASFPAQKHTFEKFSEYDDFEMVSVSTGNRERSVEMFNDKQAEWQLLFPPDKPGPNDLRPYGIPAAYIIGRDGKVAAAQLRGKSVDAELTRLLQAEH